MAELAGPESTVGWCGTFVQTGASRRSHPLLTLSGRTPGDPAGQERGRGERGVMRLAATAGSGDGLVVDGAPLASARARPSWPLGIKVSEKPRSSARSAGSRKAAGCERMPNLPRPVPWPDVRGHLLFSPLLWSERPAVAAVARERRCAGLSMCWFSAPVQPALELHHEPAAVEHETEKGLVACSGRTREPNAVAGPHNAVDRCVVRSGSWCQILTSAVTATLGRCG